MERVNACWRDFNKMHTSCSRLVSSGHKWLPPLIENRHFIHDLDNGGTLPRESKGLLVS